MDKLEEYINNTDYKYPICIITPCYNTSSEYINALKESLLQQTVKNWQWIIVNDNSTCSETIDTLIKIQNELDNVSVISHLINTGPAIARNTGWKHSSAEYLFFIDDDDIIDPTTLEKLYWCLQTENISFANTYIETFGINNIKMVGGYFYGFRFLYQNCTSSCFMIRSNIEVMFSEEETLKSGCEDWDFWLYLASKGHIGHTIKEFLFHYRQKENPRDWNFNLDERIDHFKIKYQPLYDDMKKYPCSYRSRESLNNKIGYGKISKITYHDCIYNSTERTEEEYLTNIKQYSCVPPYRHINAIDNNSYQIDIRCNITISESPIIETTPSTNPIINIQCDHPVEYIYVLDNWDDNTKLYTQNTHSKCIIIIGNQHHDREYPIEDIKTFTEDYHFLYKFLSIHEYERYIYHLIKTRKPAYIDFSLTNFFDD